MKALVMLSGGTDSAILTALAVKKYGADNVKTISYFYGQKAKKELNSARNVSKLYNVDNILLDISEYFKGFSSTVLIGNREVSKDSYEERLKESQKHVLEEYVPCRGNVFWSIAACKAIQYDFDVLLDSVNADSSFNGGYLDKTPYFAEKMQANIYDGTGRMLNLEVPFMTLSKSEVLKKGAELDVPLNLTYGCYGGHEKPCGVCLGCRDRKRAFKEAGLKDPAIYEVM